MAKFRREVENLRRQVRREFPDPEIFDIYLPIYVKENGQKKITSMGRMVMYYPDPKNLSRSLTFKAIPAELQTLTAKKLHDRWDSL